MAKKRRGKRVEGKAGGGEVRLNSIGATEIRRLRGEVVTENHEVMNGDGTRTVLYNIDRVQNQMQRLRRRGFICLHQCQAGERFAADYELSQVEMKSCLNVNEAKSTDAPGMPAPVWGSYRVTSAVRILGPLNGIVSAVVVEGRAASDWAEANKRTPRSGIDLLKFALDLLVTHYRLDCDCQSSV